MARKKSLTNPGVGSHLTVQGHTGQSGMPRTPGPDRTSLEQQQPNPSLMATWSKPPPPSAIDRILTEERKRATESQGRHAAVVRRRTNPSMEGLTTEELAGIDEHEDRSFHARRSNSSYPPIPEAARSSASGAKRRLTPAPISPRKPPVIIEPRGPIQVHSFVQELNGDVPLHVLHSPESKQAAAFRVLRYRLRELGDPQVVAVTSCHKGRTKSACAANLALAYAETTHRQVLLVDTDFARPRLARAIGISPARCVSVQFAMHMSAATAPWDVVAVGLENLHVLPADPAPEAARGRVRAPALRRALQQFRDSGYEHIIIDCPPILGAAEANIVGDVVDGVVMALGRGSTRRRDFEQAMAQIAPAPIIGTVLL